MTPATFPAFSVQALWQQGLTIQPDLPTKAAWQLPNGDWQSDDIEGAARFLRELGDVGLKAARHFGEPNAYEGFPWEDEIAELMPIKSFLKYCNGSAEKDSLFDPLTDPSETVHVLASFIELEARERFAVAAAYAWNFEVADFAMNS